MLSFDFFKFFLMSCYGIANRAERREFLHARIDRTPVNGGNGLIQLLRSFEISTVSLSPRAVV